MPGISPRGRRSRKCADYGLFPQFAGITVDEVAVDGTIVWFRVRAKAPDAVCWCCGQRSSHVHARYRRQLSDLPCAGRQARIAVTVRRFKCLEPRCAQSTFCEQIPGLTAPFARRTPALT